MAGGGTSALCGDEQPFGGSHYAVAVRADFCACAPFVFAPVVVLNPSDVTKTLRLEWDSSDLSCALYRVRWTHPV